MKREREKEEQRERGEGGECMQRGKSGERGASFIVF